MSAALVQRISVTSAYQWRHFVAGQTSVRLNVETWLCNRNGPELGCRSFHVVTPVVWNAPFLSTSVNINQSKTIIQSLVENLYSTKHTTSFENIFILRVYCTYLLTYLLYLLTVKRVRKLNERERNGAERERGEKKYGGAGAER